MNVSARLLGPTLGSRFKGRSKGRKRYLIYAISATWMSVVKQGRSQPLGSLPDLLAHASRDVALIIHARGMVRSKFGKTFLPCKLCTQPACGASLHCNLLQTKPYCRLPTALLRTKFPVPGQKFLAADRLMQNEKDDPSFLQDFEKSQTHLWQRQAGLGRSL